jgi:hypothetical protein
VSTIAQAITASSTTVSTAITLRGRLLERLQTSHPTRPNIQICIGCRRWVARCVASQVIYSLVGCSCEGRRQGGLSCGAASGEKRRCPRARASKVSVDHRATRREWRGRVPKRVENPNAFSGRGDLTSA